LDDGCCFDIIQADIEAEGLPPDGKLPAYDIRQHTDRYIFDETGKDGGGADGTRAMYIGRERVRAFAKLQLDADGIQLLYLRLQSRSRPHTLSPSGRYPRADSPVYQV
jgi:hypothetical protein